MGLIPSRSLPTTERLLCTLRSHASDAAAAAHTLRELTHHLETSDSPASEIEKLFHYLFVVDGGSAHRLLIHTARLMQNGDVKAYTLRCIWLLHSWTEQQLTTKSRNYKNHKKIGSFMETVLRCDLLPLISDVYTFSTQGRVPPWTHAVVASILCIWNDAFHEFTSFLFDYSIHTHMLTRLRFMGNSSGLRRHGDEVVNLIAVLATVKGSSLVSQLSQRNAADVLLRLIGLDNNDIDDESFFFLSTHPETLFEALMIVLQLTHMYGTHNNCNYLSTEAMSTLYSLLFTSSSSSTSSSASSPNKSVAIQNVALEILVTLLPGSTVAAVTDSQLRLISSLLTGEKGVKLLSHLCVSVIHDPENLFKVAYYILKSRDSILAFLQDEKSIQHMLVSTLSLLQDGHEDDVTEATLCFILNALCNVAMEDGGSEALGIDATFRFVMSLLYRTHTPLTVSMAALRLLHELCHRCESNQRGVIEDEQFISVVRVLRIEQDGGVSGGVDYQHRIELLRCTYVTLDFLDNLLSSAVHIFEAASEAKHIAIIATLCRVLEMAPTPTVSLFDALPNTITVTALRILCTLSSSEKLCRVIVSFLPVARLCSFLHQGTSYVPAVKDLICTIIDNLENKGPAELADDWRLLGLTRRQDDSNNHLENVETSFYSEIRDYLDGFSVVATNDISDDSDEQRGENDFISPQLKEHITEIQRRWRRAATARDRFHARRGASLVLSEYSLGRMHLTEEEKRAFDRFLVIQEEHVQAIRRRMTARRQLTSDALVEITNLGETFVYKTLFSLYLSCLEGLERDLRRSRVEVLWVAERRIIARLAMTSESEIVERRRVRVDESTAWQSVLDFFTGRRSITNKKLTDRLKLESWELDHRTVVDQSYRADVARLGHVLSLILVVQQETPPRVDITDEEETARRNALYLFFSDVHGFFEDFELLKRNKMNLDYEEWFIEQRNAQAVVNINAEQLHQRREVQLWEHEEHERHEILFIQDALHCMELTEACYRAKMFRLSQYKWWDIAIWWPVLVTNSDEATSRRHIMKECNFEFRLLFTAERRLRIIALQNAEVSKRVQLAQQWWSWATENELHAKYLILVHAQARDRNALALQWLRRSARLLTFHSKWRLRVIASDNLKRELHMRVRHIGEEYFERAYLQRDYVVHTETVMRKSIEKVWHLGFQGINNASVDWAHSKVLAAQGSRIVAGEVARPTSSCFVGLGVAQKVKMTTQKKQKHCCGSGSRAVSLVEHTVAPPSVTIAAEIKKHKNNHSVSEGPHNKDHVPSRNMLQKAHAWSEIYK